MIFITHNLGWNDVWIGLNDLQFEMLFEWSNQNEVKFTNWDLHQPDTRTGTHQHCVFLLFKVNSGHMVCSSSQVVSVIHDTASFTLPLSVSSEEGGQGMVLITEHVNLGRLEHKI